MKKFKYDYKPLEVKTILNIKESSDIYYLAYKTKKLDINDFCELVVKDKDLNVRIVKDLAKNYEDGIFENGTFFVYQLNANDIEDLGSGRFEATCRIYNTITSFSKIVFKEELKII